jgi:hypothetical protein
MIFRVLDRLGIAGARGFALLLGVVGLALDLTVLFAVVGGAFGLVGLVYALLCPRDRGRTMLVALNAFTLGTGAVLFLALRSA